MAVRPWRWLVLFFTRPIRLSDFSALAVLLKPKPRPAPDPLPVAAAEPIVVRRPRPAPLPELARARKDAGASVVSSMFHPELEIGVTEQPLDTLPADLRDELQRPSTGRLQGSLRDG